MLEHAQLGAQGVRGAEVIHVDVVGVARGFEIAVGVDDVGDQPLGAGDVVVVLGGLGGALALVEIRDVDGLAGAVLGFGVAVDPGLIGVVLELGEQVVFEELRGGVEGGVGDLQGLAGGFAGEEVALWVPGVGAAVGVGQASVGVVVVGAAIAGEGEVAEGVVGEVADVLAAGLGGGGLDRAVQVVVAEDFGLSAEQVLAAQ
ncbi:hypothetical protein G6O69_38325 [Pseudenhygromyxa sp. WMMC2535]|nr:hypothetical protein [Pseudenhygromyxa sp. WMMC2535]